MHRDSHSYLTETPFTNFPALALADRIDSDGIDSEDEGIEKFNPLFPVTKYAHAVVGIRSS